MRILFAAAALAAAIACAQAQDGRASFYSTRDSGSRTASGERLDDGALTAAMRPPMPLGARVRVVNKQNGRAIEVRINDRGPYIRGRIIDLTIAGARALGFIAAGTAPVRVERIR